MLSQWAVRLRSSRRLRRFGMALAALVVVAALPVLWTENVCSRPVVADTQPFRSVLETKDRRDEVNTYLTYPEWSIVHAYEDLAGVMRQSSESDFAYFASIRSYWSSLCSLYQIATSRGAVSTEYKQMLYVIGLSFAGEMGVKGLYEETIGRVFVFLRGKAPTAEDKFALLMADDYAKFLRQQPWYEFPFGRYLRRFWLETSPIQGYPPRKIERRFALTMEYGVKSVYAGVIGFAAGLTPYSLVVRSVVDKAEPADFTAQEQVKIVGLASNGATIIETPRYRIFTGISRKLAQRGRNFTEIAGNDDILITVLAQARDTPVLSKLKAKTLFEIPVQSRTGWRRIGLDLKVVDLMALMRALDGSGIEFEHVYDY